MEARNGKEHLKFKYGRRALSLAAFVIVAIALFASVAKAAPITPINAIRAVPIDDKLVAMTFDDGPHPIYTRQILAALDAYGAKATFFMVGAEMEKYPDVVKEVLKRGHAIENHTYSHPRDMRLIPEKDALLEIEKNSRLIEKMTGARPTLFRPPRGMINSALFNAAVKSGYSVVLWTVSADHHEAVTPEMMAARVLRRTHPGAIILAHDGVTHSRWKDVAATSILLETLTKKGYKFVTMPELLKHKRKNDIYNHFMTLFYIFS
ncbi:MAG: polysaccharide deacetylase family protein [bacterium]